MAATNAYAISQPVADNAKNVGSNVVAIAAGAGVAQVVTPIVPQHGLTVENMTSNWIRLSWTFTAGIVAGGAAANRVSLIPPNRGWTFDFGDHAGDNALGEITPVTSVSVIAVAAPTATIESGALTAATAATAGLVVMNWITT